MYFSELIGKGKTIVKPSYSLSMDIGVIKKSYGLSGRVKSGFQYRFKERQL